MWWSGGRAGVAQERGEALVADEAHLNGHTETQDARRSAIAEGKRALLAYQRSRKRASPGARLDDCPVPPTLERVLRRKIGHYRACAPGLALKVESALEATRKQSRESDVEALTSRMDGLATTPQAKDQAGWLLEMAGEVLASPRSEKASGGGDADVWNASPIEQYQSLALLLSQCEQLSSVMRSQLQRAAETCWQARVSPDGYAGGYAARIETLQSFCHALTGLNDKRSSLETAAIEALNALGPPTLGEENGNLKDLSVKSNHSQGGWFPAEELRRLREAAAESFRVELAAAESEKAKLRQQLELARRQLKQVQQQQQPLGLPAPPQVAAIMTSDSPALQVRRRIGSDGHIEIGGSSAANDGSRKAPHWSNLLLDSQERDDWAQQVKQLEADKMDLRRRVEETAALNAALKESLQQAVLSQSQQPLQQRQVNGTERLTSPRAVAGRDDAYALPQGSAAGSNGIWRSNGTPNGAMAAEPGLQPVSEVRHSAGAELANSRELQIEDGSDVFSLREHGETEPLISSGAGLSNRPPASMVSVSLDNPDDSEEGRGFIEPDSDRYLGNEGAAALSSASSRRTLSERVAADHMGSQESEGSKSIAGRIVLAVPRGLWFVARGAWGAVTPAPTPPPRRQHAVLIM